MDYHQSDGTVLVELDMKFSEEDWERIRQQRYIISCIFWCKTEKYIYQIICLHSQ